MKKTAIRILCIVAAALLVFGVIASCFAEDLQLLDLSDPNTVVAAIGEENVTWSDCSEVYDELVSQYGSYYDLTDPIYESLFRAVAVETIVEEKITALHAASLGLGELTEEEKAAEIAEADSVWESMLQEYVDYYAADGTDEEKAAARTEAETYYKENYGYDQAYVEDYYLSNAPAEKLREYLIKDVTVSDEEVTASREATVTADKSLYGEDLEAYCSAVSNAEFMAYYMYMYTGSYSEPEYPAYKPAGFRKVQQILLKVDDDLLEDYTTKQAAYEEQQEAAEEEAEETDEEAEEATEEEAAEPVTLEEVNAAEAAILASVAETVETINTRYAAGEDFTALAKEYSIDTAETTYEICPYTTNYVTSFVNAGMAIEAIGELSAPAVSDYGVHILKYVEDVPAGPVALTTDEFEALREDLLATKQDNVYSEATDAFKANITITYMMPTADEVQAMDEARNAEEEDAEEEDAEEDAEYADEDEYEIVSIEEEDVDSEEAAE